MTTEIYTWFHASCSSLPCLVKRTPPQLPYNRAHGDEWKTAPVPQRCTRSTTHHLGLCRHSRQAPQHHHHSPCCRLRLLPASGSVGVLSSLLLAHLLLPSPPPIPSLLLPMIIPEALPNGPRATTRARALAVILTAAAAAAGVVRVRSLTSQRCANHLLQRGHPQLHSSSVGLVMLLSSNTSHLPPPATPPAGRQRAQERRWEVGYKLDGLEVLGLRPRGSALAYMQALLPWIHHCTLPSRAGPLDEHLCGSEGETVHTSLSSDDHFMTPQNGRIL